MILALALRDRDDNDLLRRDLGREHQASVVGVRHHERADETGAHTPARGPNKLPAGRLRLEVHVKRPREVLPEEVRGARLQSPAVLQTQGLELTAKVHVVPYLHQRLDGVCVFGTRETLGRRLAAINYGHSEMILIERDGE